MDAAPHAHEAGGEQGAGAIRGVLRRRRQGRGEPAIPLGEVAAHQPETPEGDGQAEGELGIVGQGRGESGAEVVALQVQPPQPVPRREVAGRRRVALGELDVPIAMAALEGLALPGLLEPLRGVLPHGLQQAVAAIAGSLLDVDERLVDQAAEQSDRLVALAADPRRRRPRPPPGRSSRRTPRGAAGGSARRPRAGRSSRRASPAASAAGSSPCGSRPRAGRASRRGARRSGRG